MTAIAEKENLELGALTLSFSNAKSSLRMIFLICE